MKQYKLAVYIGRFQPFHNGHVRVIEEGLKIADEVIVLLGSSNTPSTIKNPFSAAQRAGRMINAHFQNPNVICLPINDYTYDENKWIKQIQNLVDSFDHRPSEVVLLGYQRDESSYYLSNFPRWKTYFSDEHHHYNEPINGTQLRNMYFENPGAFFKSYLVDMLPEATIDFMKEFACTEEFKRLQSEWQFIQDYKKSWSVAPYPPVFVTTDACVIQSGHVLLIERGAAPGKGLWALPGGFLDPTETIFDGCIRELREETKLKVPEKVLRGSMTYSKVFDNPRRSERGRTVTNAFLFELADGEALPRVRGDDDASNARWFTFAEVEGMAKAMYEDHWHMTMHMINRSK